MNQPTDKYSPLRYFSSSKKTYTKIEEMATPYLENAMRKLEAQIVSEDIGAYAQGDSPTAILDAIKAELAERAANQPPPPEEDISL
jgi:hypothetical protein